MKRFIRAFVISCAAAAAALMLLPVLVFAVGSKAVSGPIGKDLLLAKGRVLALAGDCAACHTVKGGQPLAGGLALASPIGKIYSTNITPDKATGIGGYSFEEFDRALRQGIAKDGRSLYPAMPYVSYAKMSKADSQALYEYFIQGVAPVTQANRAEGVPWPLSMRWPLSVWRRVYAPKPYEGEAPAVGDVLARGRYLVEGLGHCSACHTPRGSELQELALTDDGKRFLSGGLVEGHLAKNLRGDTKDGLGAWSVGEIVAFLKSGRNGHSAAFGPMAQVVSDSTQHLDESELTAIAVYLKSLSPRGPSQPGPAPALADDMAAKDLFTGAAKGNGALTFLDNCAACHRTTGSGYAQTFPRLAGSSTVNTEDPTSLIHLVLRGAEMPSTTTAPTHYAMPPFDDRLSDKDVADVLTFVRRSWGNHASPVTEKQVAKVRKRIGAVSPEAKETR